MRVILAVVGVALALGALPAGAHATDYTLRPSSTISNGWSLNGTTVDSALAEVISQPAVPVTSSGFIFRSSNGPVVAEVGLPTQTLGPAESVRTTTAWAYVQPGSNRSIKVELRSGGVTLATATAVEGQPAQWLSASTSAALTQTQLSGLSLRFTLEGTGNSTSGFVYAAYVDLRTYNFAMATSATPSFTIALNGRDRTATYTVPLSLEDTRATSSGWRLTVTSTQFTTGGAAPRTLPASASAITGITSSCTVTPCVSANSTVSYPVTVPAGPSPPTAVTFANAASGTGTGTFGITPTVAVAIPGNAYAGSYTSTLTLALVSGP